MTKINKKRLLKKIQVRLAKGDADLVAHYAAHILNKQIRIVSNDVFILEPVPRRKVGFKVKGEISA